MATVQEIYEQVVDMGEQLGLVQIFKSWASADLTRQSHVHFEVHQPIQTPNQFQDPREKYPCFDITIQMYGQDKYELFLRRLYPGFTMGFSSVHELRNALIMILKDEL